MVSVDDERADKKSLPHVLPVATSGGAAVLGVRLYVPIPPAESVAYERFELKQNNFLKKDQSMQHSQSAASSP